MVDWPVCKGTRRSGTARAGRSRSCMTGKGSWVRVPHGAPNKKVQVKRPNTVAGGVNVPGEHVSIRKGHRAVQAGDRLKVGGHGPKRAWCPPSSGRPSIPPNTGLRFDNVHESAGLGHWHPTSYDTAQRRSCWRPGCHRGRVRRARARLDQDDRDIYGHIQAPQQESGKRGHGRDALGL